jgi:predicted enzyme related to lactoylglutathione lyase
MKLALGVTENSEVKHVHVYHKDLKVAGKFYEAMFKSVFTTTAKHFYNLRKKLS